MLTRVKAWLAHRYAPAVIALLAALLVLPTLGAGAIMDDHTHRMGFHPTFTRAGGPRGDWDVFRFLDGDPAALRSLRDSGIWPWWTVDGSKLAFLRPLASLLHALDYRVWPEAHALMHFESVLLYAATAFVAALFYRRLLGATACAGLAALLFAVDDAHSMVIAWIANRHAILSTFFGFLALLAHHRARAEGWKPGLVLAPLALAASMFSGESGVSALAYLFAYTVFLDESPLRSRALALVPHAGAALLWFAAYKLGGYGAAGGSFYIDPLKQAGTFAAAVAVRLPVLVAAELAAPPADVWMAMSAERIGMFVGVCVVVTLVVLGTIFAVVRRDRRAAFFTVGMVLSLLPACAVWPGDRLLLFAGLGGSGLVATMLSAGREHLGRPLRIFASWVTGLLILLHLVLAPLLLPLRAVSTGKLLHGYTERAITSMPGDDVMSGRILVVVTAPDAVIANTTIAARINENRVLPKRFHVLTAAVHGTLEATRVDERTLGLTLSAGFWDEPTSKVFRDPEAFPLRVGDVVEVEGMRAEVVSITSGGVLPERIDFRFDRSLDDPSMVWVAWEGGRFAPFVVPRLGETRSVKVADYMTAIGGG